MDEEMETPEIEETPNVKQMRERMEAQKAELEALRAEKRALVFEQAGLPLSKGIGKAVSTILTDYDVTVDQVVKVAQEEFDWNPDVAGTEQVDKPAPPAPAAPVDQRLDQITPGSTPVAAAQPAPAEEWARTRDEALEEAIKVGVGNEAQILKSINAELRAKGFREVIPIE